ncbi:MAG: RNA methyltransferase [Crocinitomicaceae bacterium]
MVETLSKNKIKWIKSLHLKKQRDSEGVFIVEGDKMVSELIQFWQDQIEFICTSDTTFKFNGTAYLIDEKTIKEIGSLTTPNKFLAVVKKPIVNSIKTQLVLVLDGVQDPGNFGTIVRTADWFGVDLIVCSKGTVDMYNSKVVQSSMGSLFRIPIIYNDLTTYLSNATLPIFGALLEGQNVYSEKLPEDAIIVMGNEGSGISEEVKSLIQHKIHIPRFGGAESLNVSIATGILLSEFKR